ncbi:hypothetical protein A7K50_01390 [Dehalobacter sp. MCB1]|uniref:FxLYD domain-containing protein n=1 Tax=unclassified Dehalobacter TaxID=2635733 RepID=UPI000E6BCA20|nr:MULTISPECIES: FxLYD domain-containing protein [unclassified Dehalobacter]RJE47924.1 hypothetical protein A7K50_01390 [Dehalobacter sp. MCB1]TCX56102.1 zinc ribbon domain-containing protein [Dehalobacter sp. 12DCB1]
MEKIINCKVCNAEIAKSAKVCPSCGAKQKKPILKKWWFWLVVVIFIGILGSALSGPQTINNPQVPANKNTAASDKTTSVNKELSSEVTSSSKPAPVKDFEIVGDLTTQHDQFAFYISGTLKNNTKKLYSYAQITFNLYDSNGNQIGMALANVNNFEAGGTWKFKAMGMGGESNDVASYKFVDVDAF